MMLCIFPHIVERKEEEKQAVAMVQGVLAQGIEQGRAIEQVLQQAKVWEKRKGLVKHALKRFSSEKLGNLLNLAHTTDRSIKGIHKGNSWDLLSQLTLGLSGTALNPNL